MIAYLNGKYLSENDLKISPNDRGFLFADGVYEFMSFYYDDFFLFDEHIIRLKRSLKEISINLPEVENIGEICYRLIDLNKFQGDKIHIYIEITRGVRFPRSHQFPPENHPKTIYITPLPFNSRSEEKENGVKAITTEDIRWARCDIKTIALLPNVLAMQKAIVQNASESLFVRDGNIMEGTHSNFFAVKNGILYTPPLSNFILRGTIRDFLINRCKEIQVEVVEEDIQIDKLSSFDEFFITSTTYEITPVIQIDNIMIGKGKPGNLTRKLQKEL